MTRWTCENGPFLTPYWCHQSLGYLNKIWMPVVNIHCWSWTLKGGHGLLRLWRDFYFLGYAVIADAVACHMPVSNHTIKQNCDKCLRKHTIYESIPYAKHILWTRGQFQNRIWTLKCKSSWNFKFLWKSCFSMCRPYILYGASTVPLYENHIFQCIGHIFCVDCQQFPLEHKISYTFVEKCVFYSKMKLERAPKFKCL